MTRGQTPLTQMILNILGQLQQAHQIGDVATAFRQSLGQLFLRMAKPIHQLAITLCLFNGVQISALNVLNDRDLKDLGIIEFPHDDRHVVHLSQLRCPPATFARDDFVFAVAGLGRTHDQGLNHALFTD